MRVTAHQHRARQGVGAVGDHRMADALFGSDIMESLDAKAPDKLSAIGVRLGRSPVRRRNHVVKDDSDLFGVVHLQNVAPLGGEEAHVEHHRDIDIDDHEIARLDAVLAAVAGEDLLDDRHPGHGWAPSASHRKFDAYVLKLASLSREYVNEFRRLANSSPPRKRGPRARD